MPKLTVDFGPRSTLDQEDLSCLDAVWVASQADYVQVVVSDAESEWYWKNAAPAVSNNKSEVVTDYFNNWKQWLDEWESRIQMLIDEGYDVSLGPRFTLFFLTTEHPFEEAYEKAIRLEREMPEPEVEITLHVMPDAVPEEVMNELEQRHSESAVSVDS